MGAGSGSGPAGSAGASGTEVAPLKSRAAGERCQRQQAAGGQKRQGNRRQASEPGGQGVNPRAVWGCYRLRGKAEGGGKHSAGEGAGRAGQIRLRESTVLRLGLGLRLPLRLRLGLSRSELFAIRYQAVQLRAVFCGGLGLDIRAPSVRPAADEEREEKGIGIGIGREMGIYTLVYTVCLESPLGLPGGSQARRRSAVSREEPPTGLDWRPESEPNVCLFKGECVEVRQWAGHVELPHLASGESPPVGSDCICASPRAALELELGPPAGLWAGCLTARLLDCSTA